VAHWLFAAPGTEIDHRLPEGNLDHSLVAVRASCCQLAITVQ
jgi:hypothetical protein